MAVNGSNVGSMSNDEVMAAYNEARSGGPETDLEAPLTQVIDDAAAPVDDLDLVRDLPPVTGVDDVEGEDGRLVDGEAKSAEVGTAPLPQVVRERNRRQSLQERNIELERELAARGVELKQATEQLQAWRATLEQERARREQAARAEQEAAAAAARAAEDPEPDPVEQWAEHVEWKNRKLERELGELRSSLEGRSQQFAGALTIEQAKAAINQRIEEMARMEDQFAATPGNEDYHDAYDHLEAYHTAELQALYGDAINPQTRNYYWKDELETRRARLLASCFNVNPQTGRPDARYGWRQDRHLPTIVKQLARAAGFAGRAAAAVEEPPARGMAGAVASRASGRMPERMPVDNGRRPIPRTGVRASDRASAVARATEAAAGRSVGHGASSASTGMPDAEALARMSKEDFNDFYDSQQRVLKSVMYGQ